MILDIRGNAGYHPDRSRVIRPIIHRFSQNVSLGGTTLSQICPPDFSEAHDPPRGGIPLKTFWLSEDAIYARLKVLLDNEGVTLGLELVVDKPCLQIAAIPHCDIASILTNYVRDVPYMAYDEIFTTSGAITMFSPQLMLHRGDPEEVYGCVNQEAEFFLRSYLRGNRWVEVE